MFTLHPQLEKDTLLVGDLGICRVLLSGMFSQYPWLIMVPMRTACRDITDVPEPDYLPMMEEVKFVHDKMRAFFKPDKMNIGALGNAVPQLHIHVIARFKTDEAWPAPVWGIGKPTPYADGGVKMLKNMRDLLGIGA